jgi:hypothetical protein
MLQGVMPCRHVGVIKNTEGKYQLHVGSNHYISLNFGFMAINVLYFDHIRLIIQNNHCPVIMRYIFDVLLTVVCTQNNFPF